MVDYIFDKLETNFTSTESDECTNTTASQFQVDSEMKTFFVIVSKIQNPKFHAFRKHFKIAAEYRKSIHLEMAKYIPALQWRDYRRFTSNVT